MGTSFQDIYCQSRLLKIDKKLSLLPKPMYYSLNFRWLRYAISMFEYDIKPQAKLQEYTPFWEQDYYFVGDGNEKEFIADYPTMYRPIQSGDNLRGKTIYFNTAILKENWQNQPITNSIYYDTYLNIAPHDSVERLKRVKGYGIKQVQYNLEIANKTLFEETCPGKLKYDIFAEKLVEAVSIMGRGNVRSNFVFGLQDKEELISEIKKMASYGIVADYSVFQPKNNTPFQNRKAPDFDDVLDFSERLTDIYYEYKFKPIFCSLSSRSSIVNEIYEDRYKNNI